MKGLLRRASAFRSGHSSSSVPAGLLAKAKDIRSLPALQKTGPTSTDFLRDKEKTIMAELDAILEKNRLIITEKTIQYEAQSSGGRLPLMVNIAAGSLLLFLGLLFFWLFNRSETSLVSEERRLATAEGRIIAELRRSSQEELSRKQAEMEDVQKLLAHAERSKASLVSDMETELSRRESLLKAELEAELEAERHRLLREGLGEAVLNARLQAFEEQKRREYDEKQATVRAEFESRLKEQTDELNRQLETYQISLAAIRQDKKNLEAALQNELALARTMASRDRESAATVQSETLSELEKLSRRQEESRLAENRILAFYDEVSVRISRNDPGGALEQLDLLEDFVKSPGAARISTVQERRKVESFLITSLRHLIRTETTPPTAPSAPTDVSSDDDRVAKAVEAAEKTRTAEIARKKERLEGILNEADSLFENHRYEASVERYREALRLLEDRAAGLEGVVPRLLEAGHALESVKKPPETAIRTGSEGFSPEDKALLAQARDWREQRRRLLGRIEEARNRYAAESKTGEEDSEDKLVALLSTKLLIRQALSDDAVRKSHPDLYKTIDSVFEAYGAENRLAGGEEAIREVTALTERLAGDGGTVQPFVPAAEDSRRKRLLADFLGSLKQILAGEDRN